MPLGINHVAKLAGTSTATVSRVLNGSHAVSQKTAERVQKIIGQLNYVPNYKAVQLKNQRSQIYGIVIPDLTNPFFTETVKLFEELLYDNSLELLVANTDFHNTRTWDSVKRMLRRRVDGIAFLTSELETAPLDPLIHNGIPVVTTDHYRTALGVSDIVIDFADGMAQVIGHLKNLGHQQVGFIGGTEGLATSNARRASFLGAIVKHGLSSRGNWMVEGDFRIEGGSAAMARILAQPEHPSAIVAANDLTAIGALRTAHQRGLKIPQDISIVGCDDIELSDIVNPPLTTLRISREKYARLLFETLHVAGHERAIQGRTHFLPTNLVIRKSTGPAPLMRQLNHRP